MPEVALPSGVQKDAAEAGSPDIVLGVSGQPDAQALRERVTALRKAGINLAVVCAGHEPVSFVEHGVRYVLYLTPQSTGHLSMWAEAASAQRAVLAVAADMNAPACMIAHSDLAVLDNETVRRFTRPVLDGGIDLVMPLYPDGHYDALLNRSLLAPLSRALYGRRIHIALPADFCVGAKLFAALRADTPTREQNIAPLLWPGNTAAMHGAEINEVAVHAQHAPLSDSMDLSAALTELAGSLFQQAETRASSWQHVRGSRPVTEYGNPEREPDSAEPETVDVRPILESFVTGVHNLEEIWRLVLPPATLLELRRLARLGPEEFSMPDAVWARIVYDFALAHRMRRVSRPHLLGAFTPLYLGWVASWVSAVGGLNTSEVALHQEQVAKAYEEQKPYFVGRWRWPDR